MIFVLVTLFGFAFLLDTAFTAQEGKNIPEEIMIFNKGYRRKVHGPVRFTHLAHIEDYGIECTECHHTYRNGKNVWKEGDPVKKCIACHSPVKKQGKNVPRLVFAYHFKCKNCHRENESGPIKCKDCHGGKKQKNTEE